MSVPPPFSQQRGAEPREDCRDYLRTGRCKYGASCKYHHPPNVQSGGGMKTPLDPSEPMFPIRPNEPVCQYYMKHGTCKFGQACKFHHPPQSSATATLVGAGGAVVVNVGRKNEASSPLLINAVGADSAGSPMMLQFLPQRPDEPDCIFFLKNGRCKYGATCRYHHPVAFHQRRQEEVRRQRVQVQQVPDGMLPSKLQFVGQPVQQAKFPQQTTSGGTHVVTSDGSVAFVTLDGNPGSKGSFQPVSISMNSEGASYCAPVGLPLSTNHDQASSSSSIASSYDTATSNIQLDANYNDPPGALWNRQKSTHPTMNVYPPDSTGGAARPQTAASIGTRLVLAQSTSDNSIASSRRRAASYGSASDYSGYMEASGGTLSRPSGATLSQAQGVMKNGPVWRGERSPNTYDSRRQHATQYSARPGDVSDNVPREGVRQHVLRSHRPKQRGHRPNEAVDDGLSMMTSALLNMLDTPEEVHGESYEQEYENEQGMPPERHHHVAARISHYRDDRMGSSRYRDDHALQEDIQTPRSRTQQSYQGPRASVDQEIYNGIVFPPESVAETTYQDARVQNPDEVSPSWYPSWQGYGHPSAMGRPLDDNAQSMSVIQPHANPGTHHPAGLFLP